MRMELAGPALVKSPTVVLVATSSVFVPAPKVRVSSRRRPRLDW
ncbi:MAG: hypothetical protein PW843_09135 [Azospirillaceae bacterium]|nr:hypothetical protein [Azospirillaceae bacterium]